MLSGWAVELWFEPSLVGPGRDRRLYAGEAPLRCTGGSRWVSFTGHGRGGGGGPDVGVRVAAGTESTAVEAARSGGQVMGGGCCAVECRCCCCSRCAGGAGRAGRLA